MTDNAGNIGKSVIDNETGTSVSTPSANTNPYNLTTSAPTNLRSTTSLTIIASATDNEQTTLYYDLYWNGNSTVTETKQGTRGNTVTFTARNGLIQATQYLWKIVVRDGLGGKKELSSSAYTNCPGPLVGWASCTSCAGYGLLCVQHGNTNCFRLSSNINDTYTMDCKLCKIKTTQISYNSFIDHYSQTTSAAATLVCTTCNRKVGMMGYTPWVKICSSCDGYGVCVSYCKHGYTTLHSI